LEAGPCELEVRLKVVGWVKHGLSDEEVRGSAEGVCGRVVVAPEYREGLRGLEGFSHVLIVAYLHKVSERQRSTLLVRPRRLLRLGLSESELPLLGVFATDSPHRPNPIALTVAELRSVDEEGLEACGLDLFDSTPVIDIKPYTPDRAVREPRVPRWYEELAALVEKRAGMRVPI